MLRVRGPVHKSSYKLHNTRFLNYKDPFLFSGIFHHTNIHVSYICNYTKYEYEYESYTNVSLVVFGELEIIFKLVVHMINVSANLVIISDSNKAMEQCNIYSY